MPLPNFFIIGAAKCGTTTLYSNLKLHPQIFMPRIKEPCYYLSQSEQDRIEALRRTDKVIRTRADYLALFKSVTVEKAIGEASPSYLFCDTTVERIYADVPTAKIIVVLRQPAERAYSLYNFLRMLGLEEDTSFETSFRREADGEGQNERFKYKVESLYYASLVRWIDVFGAKQVRVYLFEELKDDFDSMMTNIFQYLQVDEMNISARPILANQTGSPPAGPLGTLLRLTMPTNKLAASLRRGVLSVTEVFHATDLVKSVYYKVLNQSLVPPPPMPVELKIQITNQYFKSDILKLESLLERDLSHWLG